MSYRINKGLEKEEPTTPLLKSIDMLCAMTEYSFTSEKYIKQAFLLGLWHESFPEYMLGNVEIAEMYDYSGLQLKGARAWDQPYANLQKFQFISNTGDSWHQCYRDLRERGWKRLKIHRNGGRLQYLLHNHRLSMPDSYQDVHLVLDISISTCKQVQVGTKMVEQPIFETKCEDLVELPDEDLIKDLRNGETVETIAADVFNKGFAADEVAAEVVPLIVINNFEELVNASTSLDKDDSIPF